MRLSQECVEFSLKACLRLVGVEYPKTHDASDVLLSFKERFPPWFQEKIDEVAMVSARLAMKREIAFYGAEDETIAPEEAVSKSDAENTVKEAEQIYMLCEKMFREYESAPS
ncbi:MAG: HEPN domain-containing protein [Thermoproteota archaeon]